MSNPRPDQAWLIGFREPGTAGQNLTDYNVIALPACEGNQLCLVQCYPDQTKPPFKLTNPENPDVAMILELLAMVGAGMVPHPRERDHRINVFQTMPFGEVRKDVRRLAGWDEMLTPDGYYHAMALARKQETLANSQAAMRLTLELLEDLGYARGVVELRQLLQRIVAHDLGNSLLKGLDDA